MNSRYATTAAILALAIGSAGLTGCSTGKTEGERTMESATEMEQAAAMITKGEQQEADGKALEARGRAVRDQGDSTEGTRLINEGLAKQKTGRALIEQGRRVKADVD